MNLVTVWMRCPVDLLLERVKIRAEVFDHNHTLEVLLALERLYETSFLENPPENLVIVDTSLVLNTAESFAQLAKNIGLALERE